MSKAHTSLTLHGNSELQRGVELSNTNILFLSETVKQCLFSI